MGERLRRRRQLQRRVDCLLVDVDQPRVDARLQGGRRQIGLDDELRLFAEAVREGAAVLNGLAAGDIVADVAGKQLEKAV
jgi:hypothetical protein